MTPSTSSRQSDLLFDESPLVIQRSAIRAFGLLEALLLQQLRYWSERATCVHNGRTWVYKTYQDWSDELGVSAKACRGALDRLRREGLVAAIQNPADPRDRTLWWRLTLDGDQEPDDAQEPGPGAPPAPEGSSGDAEGTSRARVPRPSALGEKKELPETTSRERASARADAPARGNRARPEPPDFPESFPDQLRPVAVEACKVLAGTAELRGAKAVQLGAVARAVASYPDRDHRAVAGDVEHWLLYGNGQRAVCKDVVARYRKFLETSEPVAKAATATGEYAAPRLNGANGGSARFTRGAPARDFSKYDRAAGLIP